LFKRLREKLPLCINTQVQSAKEHKCCGVCRARDIFQVREPQGAQALRVSEGNIRRRGAVALVVGDDLHAVVHPHAHAPARHSRPIGAQERCGHIWNIQASAAE